MTVHSGRGILALGSKTSMWFTQERSARAFAFNIVGLLAGRS